jgi:chromosome segregation protein
MQPKLTSLELHGYKTFAARTLFEFPGMITAIVGPNGSGKSNIADSLRWVLGEQSYSLLRGKKTEDMIYSGSEHRAKAGMASATITFDNNDGWLPIDFSEVSITRRAYRDGQNEYLLNGQKIRLKDITELLANSGLSERTYTIIGQGLVDAALALKPEERRRLFEEAAGIGLYRSRRDEALNRLETTQRNWERVEDIIAELEPRLASLEKQAKKVQEYERIKADLQLLLREWYGYHWRISQQELTHVLDVVKAQESRLDQARETEHNTSQELSKLRGYLQNIRNELALLHQESSQYHTEKQTISRELAVLEERLKSLSDKKQNLQAEKIRLEAEIQTNISRFNDTNSAIQLQQTQYDEARLQATEVKQSLDNRMKEREGVEKCLRAARHLLSELNIKNSYIESQISQIQSQIEIKKTEIETSAGNQAKIIEQINQLEKQLAELDQIRQNTEKERAQAFQSLQKSKSLGKELEENRKESLDKKYALEATVARINAQIKVIDDAEKSLSGYSNGARFLLNLAKEGKAQGIKYALSSQIDVPQEIEVAVSAVLGEFVDTILIDQKDDLEQVLDLLSKEGSGRAALVVKDDILSQPVLHPIKDNTDCLGIASELVKTSEDLKPVIDLLLGQTFVVRNRNSAKSLLNGKIGAMKAVTLQGEIFYANGYVVAGRDVKVGTISRPRLRRELNESLNTAEKELRDVVWEINHIEKKIKDRTTKEQQLEQQYNDIIKQKEKSENDYQQAVIQMQQLNRQRDWQQTRHKDLENELQKLELQNKKLVQDKKDHEIELNKVNNEIHLQGRALSGLPLDELQSQLAHWNTEIAVTERALNDSKALLKERDANVTRLNQQLKESETRFNEVSQLIKESDEKKNNILNREAQCTKKIEELQGRIAPLEEELANSEARFDVCQDNEAAAQQALTVAERYYSQAQLDLTRRRETLETLRRRIEEDFGLVSFEYAAEIPGQTTLPFEGMVEQLPHVKELTPGLEESISRQKAQIRRLGAINFDAQTEYNSVKERYDFLKSQVADLIQAEANLKQVIAELDDLMKREFRKTFDGVASQFQGMFTRLFGGGSAHLVMTDPDNPTETGIDIQARLPGKREQGLSLLSGGERSLTATALVFALLKYSPTPFCVLDEVDAMLDEANVGRFRELLIELSQKTQFIVITHNRNTVQAADVIYGITLSRESSSQIISLKLDEISEDMVK